MNRHAFLIIMLFLEIKTSTANTIGGHIEAEATGNNNLTYTINLYLYSETGLTTIPNGDLNFGDGSPLEGLYYPSDTIAAGSGINLYIFRFNHSYPGPGSYTISLKEHNRSSGIINLPGSVNVTFYTETLIIIDPYLGSESSPHINGYLPFYTGIGFPYSVPLSVTDKDNDSLAYIPVIPKSDRNTGVQGFTIPDSTENKQVISQMFVTPLNGDIIWQTPAGPAPYSYALRIEEWRKTHSGAVKIGYVVLDFEIFVTNYYFTSVSLSGISDTAIYSGNDLNLSCRLSGSEGDSIRLTAFTDIPGSDHIDFSGKSFSVNVSPDIIPLSLTGLREAEKNKPYKLSLMTSDISARNYSNWHSSYIWISDKLSSPAPPSGMKKDFYFEDRIRISWTDNSTDEAGYLVERSDTYNPGFIRMAALPENSTCFTDYNVLPGRNYYYKVTAMGTISSASGSVLIVPYSAMVTALEPTPVVPDFSLYPNPVRDFLTLCFYMGGRAEYNIVITDISGQVCKRIRTFQDDSTHQIRINVSDIKTGLYILAIEDQGLMITRKFFKIN